MAFILPSITEMLPVPIADKLPRTMMLPPPNFTVGIVLFGLKTCPSSLHREDGPLHPLPSRMKPKQLNFGFLSIILFPNTSFLYPYVPELISTWYLCVFSLTVELSEGSATLDCSYEFHCLSFVY